MSRWVYLLVGSLFLISGVSVAVVNAFSLQKEQSVAEEINEEIQIHTMEEIPEKYVIPDERYPYEPSQGEEIGPETIVYQSRPKVGDRFGSLVIPSLKLKLPLIEGTDDAELAKGVGHYRTSVLPGEPDNSVLAGHRETAFKRAGELKKGDLIRVDTHEGEFTYSVSKTWIVDEDDRTVIVSTEEPVIRLVTCYPFDMVGSAPERYIIEAELIDSKKK